MKKLILVLLVISTLFIMGAKRPKSNGIKGYEIVQSSQPLSSGEVTTFEVLCPFGKLVLSGGLTTPNEPTSLEILATYPDISGESWIVGVQNSGLTTIQVSIYAICAEATWNPPPPTPIPTEPPPPTPRD